MTRQEEAVRGKAIIKDLVENYRVTELTEENLKELIDNYESAMYCGHICTSSCGNDTECDCNCGPYHITE